MTSFPVVFCASALEFVIVYGALHLLDPKYHLKAIRLAFCILCMALLSAFLNEIRIPFSSIFVFTALYICLYLLTKQKANYLLLDLALCYVAIVGFEFVLTLLIKAIGHNIMKNNYLLFGLLISIAIAMYLLNTRTLLQRRIQQFYLPNRDIAFFALFSVFFSLTILLNVWNEFTNIFWFIKWQLFFLIIMTYILNAALLIILLRKKQEAAKAEAYRLQGEYMKEMEERLRCKQHEYKNQLQTIVGLAQTLSGEECRNAIVAYAKEIVEEHKTGDGLPYVCNDAMVTAILYNKKQEAAAHGIQFQWNIQIEASQCPIKSHDMAELLNNLLNNAFEAVSCLKEEERLVELFVSGDRIEALNPVPTHVEAKDLSKWMAEGFSTKGSGRGYGLSNVKRIVEEQGGTMDIHIEGNIFIVELLF